MPPPERPLPQANPLKGVCHQCRTATPHLLKCTWCRVAQYCSKDCQRLDWKEHKAYCQFIANPETAPLPPALACCQNCGNVLVTYHPMISSRCKKSTYCSKECQKEHWKEHDPES